MALSKKQATMGRQLADKARAGDSKAIQFFDGMRGREDQIAKDYLDILNGKGVSATGKKRIILDCEVTHLSQNQVEKCVAAALAIEGGNDNARTFYLSQKENAEKGHTIAKEFLMVMDEVMSKQKQGIDVYARPEVQTTGTSKIAAAARQMASGNGRPVEPPPENKVASATVLGPQVYRDRAVNLRRLADEADAKADEVEKAEEAMKAQEKETTQETTPGAV